MDIAGWTAVVSFFFAVALQFSELPRRRRRESLFLLWFAFTLSCLGWLMIKFEIAKPGGVFPAFLVFLLCGAMGVTAWWLLPKPSTSLIPASDKAETFPGNATPLSPTQVVSLYRLFKEDLPGVKSVDFVPVIVHVKPVNATVGVEPRLHVDFVGLSKFVSFYVPSSSVTRQVIQFLADNYSTLTGLDVIELTLTKPGEHPQSTESMRFTGSIVLYHEDALSSAALAFLEDYYAKRHLVPIWRSTAYVQTQILIRKNKETLEQLAKVPAAMARPIDRLLNVTGITAGVDGEMIRIHNKGPKSKGPSATNRKILSSPSTTAPSPSAPNIYQHSEGPNSPNIVGDDNQVVINPRPARRRLSEAQIRILFAELSHFPPAKVHLGASVQGGTEARDFAQDFLVLFKALNWPVNGIAQEMAPPHRGMSVRVMKVGEHPPSADALRAAIKRLGFEVEDLYTGNKLDPDEFEVHVSALE